VDFEIEHGGSTRLYCLVLSFVHTDVILIDAR